MLSKVVNGIENRLLTFVLDQHCMLMNLIEADVLARISEIEKDTRVGLKVPDKLTDPDDLVMDAKRKLSIRNEYTERSLRSEGVIWNSGGLLITVAPKNVGRALRIFDTIIKAVRARGHQFSGSTLDIDGQKYQVSIREKLKKIENDYKKLPTDILCLKVHAGYLQDLKSHDSKPF